MDVQKILTDAAAKVGPSGQEMEVAEYFAEQLPAFCGRSNRGQYVQRDRP